MPGTHRPVAQRLLDMSIPEPNSGCWLWLGTVAQRDLPSGNRPTLTVKGRKRLGSQVSYECFKGPIPSGMLVLHTCDNGLCVNPDHLYAGTYQDNSNDMRRRRRNDVPHLPMTEDDLAFIRANIGKLSKASMSRYLRRNPSTVAYHIAKLVDAA